MPRLPTWAWILIAIAAVYLIYRGMGVASKYNGAIKIAYNKIGDGVDAMGVPFNWTNPGR